MHPLNPIMALSMLRSRYGLEVSFELRQDEIKKGAHLEQRVVEWQVASRCVRCVSQVEILVQFKKNVSSA